MGIKLGNGKWAAKVNKLLGYKIIYERYFERSFDFARSSTTTRVNKDGYVEDVASDTARIDYATSPEGALLTEPASTNLITYPISFGNSYWTKSGASIEGDSSTAGSELVTNGDFESGDVDWNKGTGWTITDVGGWSAKCDGTQTDWTNLIQTGVFTLDKFYIINFDVTVTSGTLRMSIQTPSTYLSEEFTTSGNKTVYAIASGTGLFVQGNTDFTGSIDNISVKEVQGFEAPKVDTSGDLEREAYKLVEDTSNGIHVFYRNYSASGSAVYTHSVYAKKGERSWVKLIGAGGNAEAYFDLENGVLGSVNYGDAKIEAMANGWYRCSVTGEISVGGTTSTYWLRIADADNSDTYTGDGTSGLYIAYAQLEESDYASSLMLPTTEGSTTSRVADACTGSGTAQDFKDYNASGVLYAEIAANSDDGTTSRYISINDGAFNDFIQLLYLNTSNTIRAQLYVGGVMQVRIDHVVTDTTVFHKTAFRWYGNTTTAADGRFSLWIDGAMVESEDVSGLTIASGTLTTMDFDYLNGTQNFYGKTRALEVLPYMSDTEMSLLTSP